MNLTNKILLLLLLFTFNNSFSQDWIETSITEDITIDFPGKSQKDFGQGQTVFSSIDDNAAYLVTILKIPDTQSLFNLNEFYEGNIKGTLDASGGTLVSKNKIISNTISGVDIEFDTPPHPQLPQKRFTRILLFKPYLVTIGFMPLSKNLSASQLKESRTKFFNSIKVSESVISESKASNVSEDSDLINSSAYKKGFLFGQILGYIFLIGVLIGLVFLVRMLIKRNKVIKQPEVEDSSKNELTEITCTKCETPNKSSSKYCNRCGFKL